MMGKETVRDNKTKRVIEYQDVVIDHGVSDKRLLDLESEFSSVLRVAERDGNTLSAIIRQAWDDGNLRILTKCNPAKATGAHMSMIGHITRDELLKYLTSTEAANGLANRFLWVCVRRSKLLPDGGELQSVDFVPVLKKLSAALRFAREAGELTRDEEAAEMWRDVYPQLTAESTGLFGSVTSRSEAQTLRLSLVYALLDGSRIVRAAHLAAALEVWRYCEDSARFIFGDTVGDQTADQILRALRDNEGGMTRKEISVNVFAKNKRANEITRALDTLARLGLARAEMQTTGGRHAELWKAVIERRGPLRV
jgi:hypothetical protein